MYQLIYWPMLQGRGELVRLMLEDSDAPYDDVARRPAEEGGGVECVRAHMHGQGPGAPGFAPPFLIDGDLKLAQVATICAYLGPRHGLAPDDEAGQLRALQLQLTVADVIDEAHDTHHPISSSLYYEEQRPEAERAARAFREQRLPSWLGYFERVLTTGGGDYLLGADACYADLGLFQLVAGLRFAFPETSERLLADAPAVAALHDRVAARPRIAGYLQSDRRIPWGEHGIFRHYPELDG